MGYKVFKKEKRKKKSKEKKELNLKQTLHRQSDQTPAHRLVYLGIRKFLTAPNAAVVCQTAPGWTFYTTEQLISVCCEQWQEVRERAAAVDVVAAHTHQPPACCDLTKGGLLESSDSIDTSDASNTTAVYL